MINGTARMIDSYNRPPTRALAAWLARLFAPKRSLDGAIKWALPDGDNFVIVSGAKVAQLCIYLRLSSAAKLMISG